MRCQNRCLSSHRKEKQRQTVVYGSLESVGVPMSGINGGLPAVDQNVDGVGNEIPNAYSTSGMDYEMHRLELSFASWLTEVRLVTSIGKRLIILSACASSQC